MNKINQFLNAVIIAGIVVLCIGIFYSVIKAGIPYQDPTPEMQIRYAVNMQMGDELTKTGACMALTGTAVKYLFVKLSHNRKKK